MFRFPYVDIEKIIYFQLLCVIWHFKNITPTHIQHLLA